METQNFHFKISLIFYSFFYTFFTIHHLNLLLRMLQSRVIPQNEPLTVLPGRDMRAKL